MIKQFKRSYKWNKYAKPISKSINSKTIQNYLAIIDKNKNLTVEIEEDLIHKAKKGDQKAKEELFKAFFNKVLEVAKEYSGHVETFEDLIQEGMMGLECALQRFKPEMKWRFSTYSKWWIRAYIVKYFSDNIRGFKVPVEVSVKLYRINQTTERLSKDLLREPTDAEIADQLGMEENHVNFLRRYLQPHFSIDAPITQCDTSLGTKLFVGENLADDHKDNARESLIRKDTVEQIRKALDTLSPRERFIVEHRYNINGESDDEGMTLEEVGKLVKLTPERVRQIQRDAETKLKKKLNK